jgi:hypothetical protein
MVVFNLMRAFYDILNHWESQTIESARLRSLWEACYIDFRLHSFIFWIKIYRSMNKNNNQEKEKLLNNEKPQNAPNEHQQNARNEHPQNAPQNAQNEHVL